MFLLLILVVFRLGLAENDAIKCPANPITPNDSETVYITPKPKPPLVEPEVRTRIPAGTDCKIDFKVPAGYFLTIDYSMSGVAGSDVFNLASILGWQSKNLDCEGICYIKLTNWNGTLKVSSPKGTMSLHLVFRYEPLFKYTTQVVHTGSYLATELQTRTIYKLFSPTNDRLSITVQTNKTSDLKLLQINVFFGDDIRTVGLIGQLGQLLDDKGRYDYNGSTLYLVRPHSLKKSEGVIVVNDASDVEALSSYSVAVINNNDAVTTTVQSGSACTFIAPTFDRLNVKSLALSAASGKALFQGQSPTQNLPKILKYTNDTDLNTRFPQLIPTQMFTVYAIDTNVTLSVGSEKSALSTLSEFRKGVLYSQNLWNGMHNGTGYLYLRSDDQTKFYNFTINFDMASINHRDTSIFVGISTFDGKFNVHKRFIDTDELTGSVSGVGNSIQVYIDKTVDNTDIRLTYTAAVLNSATSKFMTITIFLPVVFHKYF